MNGPARQLAATQSYAWSIALPTRRRAEPDQSTMTASELMFFYGAPLAHIVAYEQHLRSARNRQAMRGMLRCVRPIRSTTVLTELVA